MIKVVTVTSEKYTVVSERKRRVVLVRVASHVCLLRCKDVKTISSDNFGSKARKVFVSIKLGLRIASAVFDKLIDFLLVRRIVLSNLGNRHPRHSRPALLSLHN